MGSKQARLPFGLFQQPLSNSSTYFQPIFLEDTLRCSYNYINGQDAVNFPATEETTVWFNRVLNIIHSNAPRTKIILVRGPEDVVPAIERVLGKSLPSIMDSDRCPKTLCCGRSKGKSGSTFRL